MIDIRKASAGKPLRIDISGVKNKGVLYRIVSRKSKGGLEMDKKVKLLPIVCCGECKHSKFAGDIGHWRCWRDPMIPRMIDNIYSIPDFCQKED